MQSNTVSTGKLPRVTKFAYGIGDSARLESEATVTASIRFTSGVIAGFFCNWSVRHAFEEATSHFYDEGMDLFGTTGAIHTRADETILIRDGSGGSVDQVETVRIDESQFESMWAHFARCISDNVEPETSGLEARRTLETVMAIYESLEAGAPVRM